MKQLYDFFMRPDTLPYDFAEWQTLHFSERAKKVCQAWALQGFGAPLFAPVFYALKIAFYVYMWFLFCSYSTKLGDFSSVSHWWFQMEGLGKAIFWTILIEVIGFGGASGPLTARYMPPFGGLLYFLRPNTIKIPLFPKMPIIGGDSRNVVDVALYAGLLYALVRVCVASEITPELVLPIVILLPILGILDRTIYLAARADIYFPMAICFLFPLETGAALKIIFFGIWFWAAFSKLTPSFSSVVCVMVCNSPVLKFNWLRKRLFKNYPDDLRASRFAESIAHLGTVVEFILPILLIAHGKDPSVIFYALLGITCFHVFIFINLPMGVPMEWNVMMVYGGYVLFLGHPELAISSISQPLIISVCLISLVILPILGNLFPKYISFLLSMRYYAGTWAYSVWFFKDNAHEKIDKHITKSCSSVANQLNIYYDKPTADAILSRVIAFRLMHLPGRALHKLLPKALENIDHYTWVEGEFMAGEILGWNFGDAHLHSEPFLAAVQKRCNFTSGELRVIMVESPQFHTQKLAWRIHDAKDGLLEQGTTTVSELKNLMPWGTQ